MIIYIEQSMARYFRACTMTKWGWNLKLAACEEETDLKASATLLLFIKAVR
jgi:hypothetical protein